MELEYLCQPVVLISVHAFEMKTLSLTKVLSSENVCYVCYVLLYMQLRKAVMCSDLQTRAIKPV